MFLSCEFSVWDAAAVIRICAFSNTNNSGKQVSLSVLANSVFSCTKGLQPLAAGILGWSKHQTVITHQKKETVAFPSPVPFVRLGSMRGQSTSCKPTINRHLLQEGDFTRDSRPADPACGQVSEKWIEGGTGKTALRVSPNCIWRNKITNHRNHSQQSSLCQHLRSAVALNLSPTFRPRVLTRRTYVL